MTIAPTIRGFRAFLLGLFVVAQVAGVVPLIYDHTLNTYEAVPVAGHSHVAVKSALASPDADHHHGVLDLHDQCCALHTLAGPVPSAAGIVPVDFVGAAAVSIAAILLVQAGPDLPDRPPKLVPLI